jgi:hypothetical protein
MSFNTQGTPKVLSRAINLVALAAILILASNRMQADTGTCGGQSLTLPFTDVPGTNIFFCSIAQAFFTGLTNGTSPTAYSPGANVTRDQMAAFITRTQDSALKRGSERAAAGQWAAPKEFGVIRPTDVGSGPRFICSDGEDIWVPNLFDDTITRVHGSDGRVLGTWTGADWAHTTIAAAGFIYIIGFDIQGKLYRINPSLPPGPVTVIEDNVGVFPISITYDGLNLWTANQGQGVGGSISRYNLVTDTKTGFVTGFNQPCGIVFDGNHLWVVDEGDDALHRVNPANGAVIETVAIGAISNYAAIPIFDGSNIWVPVTDGVSVVSTSSPARLLKTLNGNGLAGENYAAAFDGERVMVTNKNTHRLSLWKATSLTQIGLVALDSDTIPYGVCSDGLHFWIAGETIGSSIDFLLRF